MKKTSFKTSILCMAAGLPLSAAMVAQAAPVTIADVAHYSYTAHAPEGGVSLEPYPNIRAWLARIEALPGFVPFPQTPAGLRAA
mgnify:CR=1 FL=1